MMSIKGALFLLVVLFVHEARAADYRFNAGDVIRVSVWREDGMEREEVILPDGSISFPLVGIVGASGKSAPELEHEIAQKLEPFIPGPVVTVELVDARGNIVYVLGEVNNPGAFQISKPTTVIQALSQAGGFTPYAGTGRIKVLREEATGQSVHPFNYKHVSVGEDLESNIQLQAGDVIVVPGGSLF